MSDQDSSLPRRGGSGADRGDATQEKNLDDALAEAADLASDLSREVGPADEERGPDSPGGGSSNEYSSAADPRNPADLDRQMAEADRLAEETAAELGGPSSADAAAKKPRRPPPPVPDFMAEFTEPPPERPEPKPEPERRPNAGIGAKSVDAGPDAPDAAGPKAPGTRADPPATKPAPSRPRQEPEARRGTGAEAGHQAEPNRAPKNDEAGAATRTGVVGNLPKPIQRLQSAQRRFEAAAGPQADRDRHSPGPQERMRNAAADLAERFVTGLEYVNRPFGWVGPDVKRAIGWVAIATLATAGVVVAVSFIVF